MKDMALLKATPRTTTGTHKARSLRARQQVPGIIYGHGEPPQNVALPQIEVERVVSRGERLLEIEMEGQTQNVLVKEVQYDPFGNHVLHIDLARVSLDEMVEVTVPIRLRGTPAGAIEGGVLQQTIAEVTIECMVRSIPEDIRTAVDAMKVGDKLFLKDLPLPEGAKLVDDGEMIVATVSIVAEEVVEVEVEEAAVTPEVIGEKKLEEGEEAAAPEEKKEKKEKE
jgi:large subunit ribosomal protein L25